MTNRTVTADTLGGWLLKWHPAVWGRALLEGTRDDPIDDFNVVDNYRSAMMDAGQPVVLWITGGGRGPAAPGLRGVGHTTGPAVPVTYRPGGDTLWDTEKRARRAHERGLFVPIRVSLLDSVVPRATLMGDPRLAGLELFRQPMIGNPSYVTPDQLAVLHEYVAARRP